MDLDDIERRTREQLRDLQEEYRMRAEPLNKILMELEMVRGPRPMILSVAQYERMFGSQEMQGKVQNCPNIAPSE